MFNSYGDGLLDADFVGDADGNCDGDVAYVVVVDYD